MIHQRSGGISIRIHSTSPRTDRRVIHEPAHLVRVRVEVGDSTCAGTGDEWLHLILKLRRGSAFGDVMGAEGFVGGEPVRL